MAKSARNINPIVLRQGMTVGSANAESDDEYLLPCFVHYPPVEEFTRVQSPSMIVVGRTGSGKTAILKYVLSTKENSVDLDPFEMSMNYVSNSDALRFVQAIGGDLDLLFQILWKHVICIEFIRLRWQVQNEEKSHTIFARFTERFHRDERKRKALSYLKEYEGRFWITVDQNIKEITEKVERKLSVEFGADVEKFKAGGQYEKRLSADKKTELVARFRKIVSSDQLAELHGVIDILDKESDNEQANYYMTIDKLDEKWVDHAIRFKLIKALIESLKTFRKIKNFKILVSLRSDVLERVVQETTDMSFQREKFEDYSIRLRWSKTDLKLMINKRIRSLLRRQYTGHDILFEDVFPHKLGNQDSFDYMVERTLMRPRDLIAFVNECFALSDGEREVGVSQIRRAEVEFSRKRRDALEQEWVSAFPTIKKIIDFAAAAKSVIVEVSTLAQTPLTDDLALLVMEDSRVAFDPIFDHSNSYTDGRIDSLRLVQEILAILYRVGAIGIKLEISERYLYSHLDEPMVSPLRIEKSSKIRFHPMLHGALRLSSAGVRN